MKKEICSIIDVDQLIDFINDNDEFWKMVDYVNWYDLIDFGRNDNHKEYIMKATDRLHKFIEKRIRYEKINKIENYIIVNNYFFDSDKLIDEYYRIYKILLRSTFEVFDDVFYSGELNVSDDGYWDLRSSIIGYGKKFLLKCINDKQLVINIGKNRNFKENFGYIFIQK